MSGRNQKLQIAEIPVSARRMIIDHDFLDRQTFGEKALKNEILHLFRVQLRDLSMKLATAQTAEDWHFVAHTLKGASASVGAMEINKLAEDWDSLGFPAKQSERSQVLALFEEAMINFQHAARASVN